jgi:Cof subfamily protein (haloacid dehalogenase superfamily)
MWKDDSDSLPMLAESIEMVAVDLDGTLLRSDGSISQRCAQTIQKAREKGVKVVIASARPPRGAKDIYDQLELDTLQINHNGALIFDAKHQKSVYHATIEGPVALQTIQLALQIEPKVTVGVELIDQLAGYKNKNPNPSSKNAQLPDNMLRMLSRPVTKVMLIGDSGRLGDLQGKLESKLQGQVGFAFSHMRLLQVVRHGVDKARALAALAKHYGIPQQRVMAIGDAPNDVGMLRWAGMGVAMGNAWESVHRAAKFTVPSNDDDGVAHAIEKFVLI